MPYKKRAIPEASRRAVVVRYGCEPGHIKRGVPCYWCGALGEIHWHRLSSDKPSAWVSFASLELDHLIPEIEGGSGEPENIVLACRRCNRSRRHWTPDSRHPHDILSEEGLPNSLDPHSRNREQGREGNREGGGSSSIYLTVPREPLALTAETARPTAATMDGAYGESRSA